MSKIKLGTLIEERSVRFIINRYILSEDIVQISKTKFNKIELKCSAGRRLDWQKTGYPQLEIKGGIYPTIPYRGKFYIQKIG